MSDVLCLRCLMGSSDLSVLTSQWETHAAAFEIEDCFDWHDVGGIIAVTDTVDADEFSDKNLQSLPWLSRQARRHANIVEAHFQCATVLPVKFGALFSSDAVLRDHVSRQQTRIRGNLSRLRGLQEWNVRVLADKQKAEILLLERDSPSKKSANDIASAAGTRYLMQRKLEQQLESRIQCVWSDLQRQTLSHLSRWPGHRRQIEPRAAEPTGHELIAHVCVLLPAVEFSSFEERLLELKADHADYGLQVEVSGPWPPYHFCPDFRLP